MKTIKTKMKSLAILIRTLCLAVLGLLLYTDKSTAQSSSNGYNKEDYDGEYDYDDNDGYHSFETEFQRSRNRYTKDIAREEELYNGGYKNRNSQNDGAGYSVFGMNNSPITSKRNGNQPNDNRNSQPLSPTRDWRSIDNPSGANTDNNPQVFNPDGSVSGGGKEIDPGEKDPETPPPPPDEPDVPVDTAIPFLLIGGVVLVYFKLKPQFLAG